MSILKIGDKAPFIEGIDENGAIFDSSKLKVVLYFYPKDNTPGCTAESCNLRDNYQTLKQKGYEVIGVSADSAKSHKGFIEKQQLPFTLIADTDKKLLKAYNAWGEKKMYGKSYEGILRKTFIISEKGIIENIIEKVDTKNHIAQILTM
jgi:peroxiredoxin Q/BCP